MSETHDDMELLFSDRELRVAKEQVTVKEFRYLEGLQAAALARPIIGAMRDAFVTGGEEVSIEALDTVIGEHYGVWLELVSMATGKPVEWLSALSDRDGTQLSLAFWEANGPFFMRRLVLAEAVRAQAMENPSRSPSSSASSSPQDSGETIATSPSASPGARSADTIDI